MALDRVSIALAHESWVSGFGRTEVSYPDGDGDAVVVYLSRQLTVSESKEVPINVYVHGELVLVTAEVIGGQSPT